ncbi:hypothetical protein BDP27DRAFT_1305171 [Rhodocollybia butyracea]|uniref:Uncharacterized protein n=1 Tax=Rhodocollybia butyracea TaxID=206335 RepID=A0A9P5P2E9_9AGAR|nr:hypothetical protein BDP27DRAFT_1305171 [Rhodocollybia butyracea]
MAPVPSIVGFLADVPIKSFAYGIFFMLSIASSIFIILRHSPLANKSKYTPCPSWILFFRSPMVIGSIGIFMCVTAHWIITFIRLFEAFVTAEDPLGPAHFVNDVAQPTYIVKAGLLGASLIIVDILVIYRLWIVTDKKLYIIVLPVITWIGLLISNIGITYLFSRRTLGTDVFASVAVRWTTSQCVFSLCTNIYCTGMICRTLIRHYQMTYTHGLSTNILKVLAIFVESATIYTAWTIFFFITELLKIDMQHFAIDVFPSVAGISFMLIQVRVGLGWAKVSSQPSVVVTSLGIGFNNGGSNIPMGPLAISISQVVVQEGGEESRQYGEGKLDDL